MNRLSLWLIPIAIACAACKQRTPRSSESNVVEHAGIRIDLVELRIPGRTGELWIGRYEVTNAQYRRFVELSGYDGSDHPSSKPGEPFFYNWRKDPRWIDALDGSVPAGKEQHPACYLNWWHAKAFCTWLSKVTGQTVRLPSRAEWRFAAGGKDKRTYPWGDDWRAGHCNSAGAADGFVASAPVGSFPKGATPEGLHDMAGNIWEWSEDRVLLGGPWCLGKDALTTDAAGREDAAQANDKFGFRILVER